MRLSQVLLAIALLAVPSTASGQPQALGNLWQSPRGSVLLTECPPGVDHDEYCRAVEVRSREGVVKLGDGYDRVRLLWTRKGSGSGPEALVLGDYGGSGGSADLFGIYFSPRIGFRKIGGDRFDTVTVRAKRAGFHLSLPFNIEFFNGAPHAGAILLPLPVLWTNDDFAIDLDELTRRTYSSSELDFRALAIREELEAWARDKFPAPRLYPPQARDGTPVTATALVEMMLSGHADQAQDLVDRAWPVQSEHGDKPLGGKSDFWAALCQAVVRQPSWKRFSLARLPHAELIEQGARRRDNSTDR